MNWQSQYRFCIYLASVLPRFAAIMVAELLARLNYICKPSERTCIRRNQSCINQYSQLTNNPKVSALSVYRSFAHICVDLLYETKVDRANFISVTHAADAKKIIEFSERHNGIVLATCHLGHWELGAMAMACLGLPISVVAESPDSKIGMQTLIERRQKFGVQTLTGKMRMRSAIKQLTNGRSIGIAADRLYGSDGRRASLFGKDCNLPKGPLFLAQVTQKPIVLCVMIKSQNNGKNIFRITFEDPIMPHNNDPKLAQVALDQKMQSVIQRYPNEWCVFENFF
ncbi:MAG: lauroyl/myristoyl acyltransferase [Candidatus Omnitrophota bacterium]|jgi:lauroyl/myristoyl acyltransferase